MSLLGPAEIRDLAEQLDLQPTKKLGQNFVVDGNTVRKIVRTAGVASGDHVLEVGPGLGSLTLGMLELGARVTAIEIDSRLAAQLPHTVQLMQPGAELAVITDDALRVPEVPGAPTALVANLPYNVSVPVLLHLLHVVPSLTSSVVMVQAEVGHRLAAGPGSRVYGSPSVKASWYGDWSLVGTISRQVFWPVPNVDSVLVGFRAAAHPGTDAERLRTFALVDAAFGQRRMMRRQSLSELLGGTSSSASAALEAAEVDPTLRGEQLTVHDFLRIVRTAS